MTESSGYSERAAVGAGAFGPSLDEIAVRGVDGQIIIQAPPGEKVCVVPFTIGDVHNAHEWAMVLGDLHPSRPLGAVGTAEEGWEDLRKETITLFSRPHAIFNAIVAAYKSGRIKHVKSDWWEEDPADLTLLRFRRDDILKVIAALGADGAVICMLMAGRDQQKDSETVGAASVGGESSDTSERQAGREAIQAEAGSSASAGGEAAIREAAKPKTKTATQRRGGRKRGSGAIDDSSDLRSMLHLLATGEATSVWDAAGAFAGGRDSAQRRLHRKFSKSWGTKPSAGNTWKDVERELNTN
jgi:hypothetical protein